MRFYLIIEAKLRPNLFHQNRTARWLISFPRSRKASSRFRSQSGNRIYIITARRVISRLVLTTKGAALCHSTTLGFHPFPLRVT